jgi:hypothetical protein
LATNRCTELIYTSHTNLDYYTKKLLYKHYINGSSKIGAASIGATQFSILNTGIKKKYNLPTFFYLKFTYIRFNAIIITH